VKKIESPTMLVFADADSIRPEHMVAFCHAGVDGFLRSAARLGVVPGATHYDILGRSNPVWAG
jgi:pimeloyl-ACP methyl ester carboxylesterase